jgi:hypothetical protein
MQGDPTHSSYPVRSLKRSYVVCLATATLREAGTVVGYNAGVITCKAMPLTAAVQCTTSLTLHMHIKRRWHLWPRCVCSSQVYCMC